MNWLSLQTLKEARFANDPRVGMNKLRRWCRDGLLPCKKQGKEWYVDLDAFDRDWTPCVPEDERFVRRVCEILRSEVGGPDREIT